MRSALAIVGCMGLFWPGMGHADTLLLPSGLQAQALEPVWDEDLSVIRLRFVVPRLAEPASLYAADPLRVFEDMQWLCNTQTRALFGDGGAPQDDGWGGAVVTLMDREVEFGTRDTDSLQLFEWFSFTMDGCELDLDEYHD